jgi:peptide/nickel transport system permease protein
MSEIVDAPVDAELAAALAAATGRPIDQGPASRRPYKRRGRVTMWLAAAWLIFIVFSAVGASWLPYVKHSCSQYSNPLECSTYDKGTPLKIERPPVWAVWAHSKTDLPGAPARAGLMGTDRNGYDIFSRAVYGARISLTIGVLSITFGLLIGGTLGLLAGYRRGWVDRVTDNTMNIMLAFPALLLAIFVVTFLNSPDSTQQVTARKIWPIVLALALLSIPPLTRLVRANTLSYAQRDFVLAAHSIGAGDRRILFREILPNVVPSMISFALTGLALLIVAEGALAYLGLSVQAPTPTWGSMIFAGKDQLQDAWWIALMPALVLFLTILSINLLGDVVAERFNVRDKVE